MSANRLPAVKPVTLTGSGGTGCETVCVGDTQDDYRLTEYKALRDEILKRFDIENQCLLFTVLLIGSTLTVGIASGRGLLLAAYPVLASFIAYTSSFNTYRVGELGQYLRELEDKSRGSLGWESWLRSQNRARWTRSGARGNQALYVGSQVGMIALSWTQPIANRMAHSILTALAVGAIALTIWLLRSGERRWHSSSQPRTT